MTICGRMFLILCLFFAVIPALYSRAEAFPIVKKECKIDPVDCARRGKLVAISIYGSIGQEDSAFFIDIDNAIPPDRPFPKVFLNSEGGTVYDAQVIGRILRKRGATVESGSPYLYADIVECSSACVRVAAGATNRLLNHIGLHRSYVSHYDETTKWTDVDVKDDELEEDLGYFDEMGINPEIKEIIRSTPSDTITNIYFDPKIDFQSQPITKLGFHMENRLAPSAIGNPSDEDRKAAANDRYWQAMFYGSNRAIAEYVTEVLKSKIDKKPDYESANAALQIGADRDDPWSLHNLAYHLKYGNGAKKDVKKSTEYYLRAARLGFAPSQINVGWAYYKGTGIKRSIPDAVFWITRAADQGQAFAYGSLCDMYHAGDVFQPNNVEAYKWCRLAVDKLPKGHTRDSDANILAKYRKKMTLSELNQGEKLVRNWKPLVDDGMQMSDTDDG